MRPSKAKQIALEALRRRYGTALFVAETLIEDGCWGRKASLLNKRMKRHGFGRYFFPCQSVSHMSLRNEGLIIRERIVFDAPTG